MEAPAVAGVHIAVALDVVYDTVDDVWDEMKLVEFAEIDVDDGMATDADLVELRRDVEDIDRLLLEVDWTEVNEVEEVAGRVVFVGDR
jgi:hypothetical protein